MHSPVPLTRDVVLVGGGHAHALMLRKWAMKPLPGARLTLINPDPAAPYTGMLPGFVAGHYAREALMIDPVRLARAAGARLILGRASGIDLQEKTVTIPGRPALRYDILSLDIGITSDLPELPGFSQFAVPAKPLGRFADQWEALVDDPPDVPKIVILGGGVGGVELALAAAHRLGQTARITVIEAGDRAVSILPDKTRRFMLEAAARYEIDIRVNTRARAVFEDHVVLEDESRLDADLVVGVAGARPHDWVSETGLDHHEGFISVDQWLRSTADPSVYAVGDCAHLGFSPRPKAGVYAVRQAPVLYHNIRADLTGAARKLYKPQGDYLKLISAGSKRAVLDRSGLALQGEWAWRLKDRIDRAFMDKFENLPFMTPPALPKDLAKGVSEELSKKPPLCAGCGAKVGSGALNLVLAELSPPERDDVLTAVGDDAAILDMGEKRQVITTDHLRTVVDDPLVMTQIAVQHALGDIWAMGATPQIGLAQITLPRATAPIHQEMLREITHTAQAALREVGADLVGGHTSVGSELTIGFTLTGLSGKAPIGLAGAKPGDRLVLTRPIGTGVLFAAEMQSRARGEDIAELWAELIKSQKNIAGVLAKTAHAMTDVTGFGLAGHLARLCAFSGVGAEIQPDAVPVWEGAIAAVEAGFASSLYRQNRDAVPDLAPTTPREELLFDPQTAGGLLAAVPGAAAIPGTWEIGRITDQPGLRFLRPAT